MYKKVTSDMNFVDREKETVKFWKENEIFEKSIEERKDDPTYTFYDQQLMVNHISDTF